MRWGDGATWLTVVVLAAGCSSVGDGAIGEPLELDDADVGSVDAPPDDDDAVDAVEGDDDGGGVDDGAGDGAALPEGDAYPPLPPLEADPDSDVPVDLQEQVLARHAEVYVELGEALADPDFDLETLDEYVDDPLRSETQRAAEALRTEGLRQLMPDSEVVWVQIAGASERGILLEECIRSGPLSGEYDAAGDLVGAIEPVPYIVQYLYDTTATRAVESAFVEGGDRCA